MKNLVLVFVVGLLGVSCNTISTTKPTTPSKSLKSVSNTGSSFTLRLVKFQGHDYIVMDGYKQGGMCHSEACKCKNK